MSVDELRRHIEALPKEQYEASAFLFVLRVTVAKGTIGAQPEQRKAQAGRSGSGSGPRAAWLWHTVASSPFSSFCPSSSPLRLTSTRRPTTSRPPSLPPLASYYEKWALSVAATCVDRGLFTSRDIGASQEDTSLRLRCLLSTCTAATSAPLLLFPPAPTTEPLARHPAGAGRGHAGGRCHSRRAAVQHWRPRPRQAGERRVPLSQAAPPPPGLHSRRHWQGH